MVVENDSADTRLKIQVFFRASDIAVIDLLIFKVRAYLCKHGHGLLSSNLDVQLESCGCLSPVIASFCIPGLHDQHKVLRIPVNIQQIGSCRSTL